MISFATLPVIVTYINLYSELRNSAHATTSPRQKDHFFQGKKLYILALCI